VADPLPLILIGPILRRVEPRLVSVFVATSKPAAVHLAVYDGVADGAAPGTELVGGDATTTAFGAQFHATVVVAPLAGNPLLAGHRYSYDLHITPQGGPAQTLKDLGFLKDTTLTDNNFVLPPPAPPAPPPTDGTTAPPPPPPPTPPEPIDVFAIGYIEGSLPSFVTVPDNLDDLVIAHASCRKPHGLDSPAMAHLDDYIDDLHGGDPGWPHQLFLTGDQIYADDVASALLPGINTLGIRLVSGDGETDLEQVPSPGAGGPFDVSTTVLPAGFRQKMTGSVGFTSESAASHLIGFGEWLAMYCIGWNPFLWPILGVCDATDPTLDPDLKARLLVDARTAPGGAPIVLGRPTPEADAAAAVITPLYGVTPEAQKALQAQREAFLADKSILDDFRREVARMRRVLANVPTYMICDDHEVSDDWFMTGQIRGNTTNNPFGKALLRNALSAFAVCQAWGDDPQAWSKAGDDRPALLTNIAGLFGGAWKGGLPTQAAADAVDATLGLGPLLQPKFDFSFVIDGPVHRVRVLDTRMRRQYDTPLGSPGLLTSAALDSQLPVEALPDGHVLVVVSPAPVFGPPVMTEIGGVIAASAYDVASMIRSEAARLDEQNVTGLEGGRPTGMQFFDAEHWGAHPVAFERLLERFSHYSRVVVLGGDVHYGAAFEMDWLGDQRVSRIVHFTCSAARNGWPPLVRNLFGLNGMTIGLQKIGTPMTRLGWSATLPQVVDDITLEPPLTRVRLQTGPVLLSDEMFRSQHPLSRPPDWFWRANIITDQRPPSERPSGAQVPSPIAEVTPGPSAVHDYGPLAETHRLGLGKAAIARGMQFLNNVGVIRFVTSNDAMQVSQSLHSIRERPDPNEKGAAYIVHSTGLDPIARPVPTTIGPEA
jgi:hypothetical protein